MALTLLISPRLCLSCLVPNHRYYAVWSLARLSSLCPYQFAIAPPLFATVYHPSPPMFLVIPMFMRLSLSSWTIPFLCTCHPLLCKLSLHCDFSLSLLFPPISCFLGICFCGKQEYKKKSFPSVFVQVFRSHRWVSGAHGR